MNTAIMSSEKLWYESQRYNYLLFLIVLFWKQNFLFFTVCKKTMHTYCLPRVSDALFVLESAFSFCSSIFILNLVGLSDDFLPIEPSADSGGSNLYMMKR